MARFTGNVVWTTRGDTIACEQFKLIARDRIGSLFGMMCNAKGAWVKRGQWRERGAIISAIVTHDAGGNKMGHCTIEVVPQTIILPPDQRRLFSGLSYGNELPGAGAYIGLATGAPPTWKHSTWCPAGATVQTAPVRPTAAQIPVTTRRCGLYSGGMRGVVQRMEGAGVAPPWGYSADSCAWLYTSPHDDSEWVIEIEVGGINAAPLKYDTALDHTCGASPSRVPIGRGTQTLIASAEDVAPYFATQAQFPERGWSASASGVFAETLTQYEHADGWRRVVRWHIDISETIPGIPDSAVMSQVSESVAYSASPQGTLIPVGGVLVWWDCHSGYTEPPGHPHRFPEHLWVEGESVQLWERQDAVGGEAVGTIPESWDGGSGACPYVGSEYPNDPDAYGKTYQKAGTRTTVSGVAHFGPSVPGYAQGTESTGEFWTPGKTALASGLYMRDWVFVRGDIYGLSMTQRRYATLTSQHWVVVAIPEGDAESTIVYSRKYEGWSAHQSRDTDCGVRILGTMYSERLVAGGYAPEWSCGRQPYWPFLINYVVPDVAVDEITEFYVPSAPGITQTHVCSEYGEGFAKNGGDAPLGPAVPSWPFTVGAEWVTSDAEPLSDGFVTTLIRSGAGEVIIDAGDAAPSGWHMGYSDAMEPPLEVSRSAENNGVAQGSPGLPFSSGVTIGTLDPAYRAIINTLGPGLWVGKPQL